MTLTLRVFTKYLLKTLYLHAGYTTVRNGLAAARGKSSVTVLAYHRVDDDAADVNAISPEIFDRQMAYLKAHYRVIGVRELLRMLQSGRNPERAVVVTFDDGYKDNLINAAPVLKKYDLPACFFLSSGFIGADRPFPHDLKRLGRHVPALTWDDVRELARLGFEIGSHTVNHARLSSCDPVSLEHELRDSRKRLEVETGREVTFFSFPFGKPGDCSYKIRQEIAASGYCCNFSAHGGLTGPDADPFDIQRQGVSNNPSLLFFRAWVEGWRIGAY